MKALIAIRRLRGSGDLMDTKEAELKVLVQAHFDKTGSQRARTDGGRFCGAGAAGVAVAPGGGGLPRASARDRRKLEAFVTALEGGDPVEENSEKATRPASRGETAPARLIACPATLCR